MVKIDLEKIKSIRKKHKLTQSEMAKIIGLKTVWQYHRREKGEQDFSIGELSKIAEHFKKPIEYFFVKVVAKNATSKGVS